MSTDYISIKTILDPEYSKSKSSISSQNTEYAKFEVSYPSILEFSFSTIQFTLFKLWILSAVLFFGTFILYSIINIYSHNVVNTMTDIYLFAFVVLVIGCGGYHGHKMISINRMDATEFNSNDINNKLMFDAHVVHICMGIVLGSLYYVSDTHIVLTIIIIILIPNYTCILIEFLFKYTYLKNSLNSSEFRLALMSEDTERTHNDLESTLVLTSKNNTNYHTCDSVTIENQK